MRTPGLFIAVLSSASGAWAQAPSSAAESAAPPQGIEEVVITAQRRSESAGRAALPVSVLAPDDLREAGVVKPQELSDLVPALQVANTAAPIPIYYLRGAGNFTGNALTDSAVAFNVGGVFIGRPHATAGFFYDLERIEVLKGPQGTLYGRNATGGAINVVPRNPQIGEWDGEANAEYGNEDYLRVDGAVNVPFGETAALRTALFHVSHDGYMDDGMDDQDDTAGRVSLLMDPTDQLSIQLTADYFDQGADGPGSMPVALDPDNRFGISAPETDAFLATQTNFLVRRGFNPIDRNQHLDNQFWGLSGTVDWHTEAGTVTIIPAYREGHLDTISTGTGVLVTTLEDDRQTSLEARLASDLDGRFDYIAGVYWFDETNDMPLFVPNTQYSLAVQEYSTGVESAAAFARLTYELTESLRGTLGARYTHEDKFFEGSFQSSVRSCPPTDLDGCPDAARIPTDQLTPVVVVPDGQVSTDPVPTEPPDGTVQRGFRLLADDDATFSNWTWRAALDWDVTEQNFMYASIETGFKSGGFFFSSDSQVFDPEELTAYTLGSKNRLLEGRLQLDVEVFHWQYDDQQISMISLDSLGVPNLRTRNVGNSTMNGVEIETQWLVTDATNVRLDAQFLDAIYDDFRFVVPSPPVTGCPVTAEADGFHVDCSDKRAPFAPKWAINMSADHAFRLPDGAELVAEARAHYRSETLTGLEFTPLEYQDSYVTFDAALTYDARDEKYYVTGFCNNITDETVLASTFQPPFGAFVVGTLRLPRLYGLRVGMRF